MAERRSLAVALSRGPSEANPAAQTLLYHVRVHRLGQRALSHSREQELLKAGERVGVAVSGGIDSVALLRLMLEMRGELGIVLSVVHFNHRLRGAESDADEQFVARLAREHNLQFICDGDDVAGFARERGISLETAARELRYGFFRHLIRSAPSDSGPGIFLNKILTGHTLDDQAETVLMRLIRGAGLRGLGGIHPRVPVEQDDGEELCGEIVRPLLTTRRKELQEYLVDIGQEWREDATNSDESFTRNRVRKLLVPVLEKEFNPVISESLSELAEIARGEEDYWQNEVSGWMGTGIHWIRPDWVPAEPKLSAKTDALVQISSNTATSRAEGAREMGHPSVPTNGNDLDSRIASAPWLVMNASIDRLWFAGEPVAVQRRIVKAVGEEAGIPLEFKHIEQFLRFASAESGSRKELSLPLGWKLVRRADELLFVTPDLRADSPPQDYAYSLSIPGRVVVHETGFTLEARRVSPDEAAAYNPDELLNADSVAGPLVVRNWRPGDRYWPAHTKSPKKVKELLQERHIARPERDLWTVISGAEEILWMRGFPVPAKYRAKTGQNALIFVQTTTDPERTT